ARAGRYQRYIKYLLSGLILSFLVWFTPHTLFMTGQETKAIGGAQHPVIGNFGVMSAKNGAINLMIVLSGITYVLYKRANKILTARWLRLGNLVIGTVFAGAILNIIGLAVYGFYLPANIRVGLSVPQFLSTVTALLVALTVNHALAKTAQPIGPRQWATLTARAQLTFFLPGLASTCVM